MPASQNLIMTANAPDPLRVVIDTNTVLDWLLFGDRRATALAAAVEQGRLQWPTCNRMRDEFERTLDYPALARWSPDRCALLAAYDHWATPQADPPRCTLAGLVCSDPDDQVFVDLAIATRSRWLVTHDRALLRLSRRARAVSLTIVDSAQWSLE